MPYTAAGTTSQSMQPQFGFEAYDRNIDVHISHLRAILKPYPEHSNRIRTIWGTGYLFVGAI